MHEDSHSLAKVTVGRCTNGRHKQDKNDEQREAECGHQLVMNRLSQFSGKGEEKEHNEVVKQSDCQFTKALK